MKIHITLLIMVFLIIIPGVFPFALDSTLISRFQLPFEDRDARYFFTWKGTLYFGNHQGRKLYKVNTSYELEEVEHMKGWHIEDAWPFEDRIYYCFRQRILYKKGGKVQTIPIESSENLISMTAGNNFLYLLDSREDGYYILVPDKDFMVIKEFPCPGREPSDIVHHDNALWIYDIKNRSVQNYNVKTREVDYIVYTGADNCYSKGIVFIDDHLYIHNRGTSSLDLVEFKETPHALLSLPHAFSFEYIIDNKNNHKEKSCNAEFRIPIPADSPTQEIQNLEWITPPGEIKKDLYGQRLGYLSHTIKPGEEFVLSYKASVIMWAVHYKVKEAPLSALASIPGNIKNEYLTDDSYYSMDDKGIRQAAKKARQNNKGKEPRGVKELIENIVQYMISTLSYHMDDTWETAARVEKNKQASCSEYSFLFSALARLNNIPTRMAGGFIFNEDDDSFHRWTEVYYPGTGWVPVDVTAIDADDPDSWDFEFLFGTPHTRIIFSLMGGIDNTALDVEYYGYKRYDGGDRERRVYVNTVEMAKVYREAVEVVELKVRE